MIIFIKCSATGPAGPQGATGPTGPQPFANANTTVYNLTAGACNDLTAPIVLPAITDAICQISAVITQTASDSAGDCNSFGNVTLFFSSSAPTCVDSFTPFNFILPSLSFSFGSGIPVTQSSVIQRTARGATSATTYYVTAEYVNSPGCDTIEALVNEITVVCYPLDFPPPPP